MVLTKKRGTNLETQLLELRHMSKPELFYLGLSKNCFETDFLSVCGPLFNEWGAPSGGGSVLKS